MLHVWKKVLSWEVCEAGVIEGMAGYKEGNRQKEQCQHRSEDQDEVVKGELVSWNVHWFVDWVC